MKSLENGYNGVRTIMGYYSGSIIKQIFGEGYEYLKDDRLYLVEFK